MRHLSLLAVACLIGGVALLAYGVALGQAQVYLVLIFPVIAGSGPVPIAGIVLMMLGFVLGFFSMARAPGMIRDTSGAPEAAPSASTPPSPAPAKRFGGVVFLGPFPIVFGSDRQMSKYMLVLAAVVTVLLLAFFLLVLFARP